MVAGLPATHGVPAALLELEVTKSALMTEPARARRLLGQLAAVGVRISIDDFGAGYTSLGQLKNLPVSELKIDRSFVMTMTEDNSDALIVHSVVDLGHNLGLTIVAEGVETEQALAALTEFGCDVAQGYHLCRPVPVAAFEARCAGRRITPVQPAAMARSAAGPAAAPIQPPPSERWVPSEPAGRPFGVDVTIEPATPDRWPDVLTVFGSRGDPSRCWCVYLRHGSVSYQAPARAGNRAELRARVEAGREPGLLAYRGGEPVGWVSAAPREQFAERLAASPSLRPLPGPAGEIWSVLCFVVPRPFRRQGVAHGLLAGAVSHARSRGAAAIEGVPRDDRTGKSWSDPTAYTGTASMFERAGFSEIDRRRADRVVYRLEL